MDLSEEIARVAYELFERDGGEHGRDREHWLEAERIVKARHADQQKPSKNKEAAIPKPRKTAVKKESTMKTAAGAPRTAAKTAAPSGKPARTTRTK